MRKTEGITMAFMLNRLRRTGVPRVLIAAILFVATLSCACTIYRWSFERWTVAQADAVVVFSSNPFGGSGSYKHRGEDARHFLSRLYAFTSPSSTQLTSDTPVLIVYALGSDGHLIACIKVHPIGNSAKRYRLLTATTYSGEKLSSAEESLFKLSKVNKSIFWDRCYSE